MDLKKKIKKILNTGSSGDLDAFGCAEYNPELVEKIAIFFSQHEIGVRKEMLADIKIRIGESRPADNPDFPKYNKSLKLSEFEACAMYNLAMTYVREALLEDK